MSLIRSVVTALGRPPAMRAVDSYSLDDYVDMLRNAGLSLTLTMRPEREEIAGDFRGLIHGAYRANGVVFACALARMFLFNQARFAWQQLRGGQPGDLFGTPALQVLEQPEPTKTTNDLLSRALIDADFAGNWFGVRRPGRIKRVRPDWCYLILGTREESGGDPDDVDAEVLGLVYQPGGPYSDSEPQTFAVGEFAHFAPIPDPEAQYRGMSWLTPVIRNVKSHSAATTYKGRFFENAATPNLIVKFPPALPKEKAQEWIELFEQEHSGALNAFRTAFLGAGADATAVGSDMDKLDFKAVQGVDETVIAAAARVHPVIVGLSEGLQGSSLNAGNYSTIKRQFGDGTVRPLWQNFSGSIQPILDGPPAGSRLWYDDRHVPFLAEDQKDAAEVFTKEAQAIRTLTDGGFLAPSVIAATAARDVRLLAHSGLLPVQVQPPGAGGEEGEEGEQALLPSSFVQAWEPTRIPSLPALAARYQARETFWPVSGMAAGLHVEAGTEVDGEHYLVRAFPQMFEPATGAMIIEGHAVALEEPVDIRCPSCQGLAARRLAAGGAFETKCRKCGTMVAA